MNRAPGPNRTPTSAAARPLGPDIADGSIRELLRRVQSGAPLTLAEYVRAEELLAASPPLQVEATAEGQSLHLRIKP